MEREFFSEFYFGNINGEAIREGKKFQSNDPQFLNSIDVPFNNANLGSGESSTSVDSMGFQAKEKGFLKMSIVKQTKEKEEMHQNLTPKARDEDEENVSDQRTTSSRRSRPAEMHNLSERRRRDRINEKLKALQELLPHCTKTDKASMLDEAIEYLKSLQIQLQMMWIESGMVPMIFPESHQYISITATDHHHHNHDANSLPYNPTITRPLFDDQSKLRDLNTNQPVNSIAQTENLYLHKFSLQGTNQREFGAGTVQEPHFADGLVIDRNSFL